MTFLFLLRRALRTTATRLLCTAPLVLALVNTAAAQARAAGPSDVPPKLERLEEGEEPSVTIRKSDPTPGPGSGPAVTRDPSGTATETRVQTGVSTYYVRPNNSPGNSQPGDLQSSGNRAAQFKIKEFDLGVRKPHETADGSQTLESAPSPPVTPVRK
ncbi:MAG: hypothetical protein NVSMB6_05870 [Burkholderiaceae bacterium]